MIVVTGARYSKSRPSSVYSDTGQTGQGLAGFYFALGAQLLRCGLPTLTVIMP